MKKISVIFLIVVMVFSVAAITVFSDNGKHLRLSGEESSNGDNQGNSMLISANTQNEKGALRGILKEQIQKRLATAVANSESFKLRKVADSVKQELKAESDKAVKSFQNSLIKAENFRVKLGLNRDKLNECKKDYNSTTCVQLRNQSVSDAKDYLYNLIDSLTSHLNSVKAQLNSSETLDQQVLNDRITNINNLLTKLADLKTKIQSTSVKEDLVSYSKELKDLLNDAKSLSSLSTETIRAGRVGEIVQRAESLEAQLARIQDKYGQNITNNAQLSTLITQFNDKITDARQKYNQSLDKFNQAKDETNSSTNHDLIQQGHDLLMKANQDLKDAHDLLKQIFSMLKGIDKNVDFNNDTCWSDRPSFIPGKDLGYFVWQSKCNDRIVNIALSGDARNLPSNTTNLSSYKHNMTGSITNNGEFKDIELLRFEANDNATVNGNVITFSNYVFTGSDEIRFKTTGTQITLDLMVDGQRQTGLVYTGSNATNPTSIPFTMNTIAANQTKCGTNQFIVNGNCSNSTGTNQAADETN